MKRRQQKPQRFPGQMLNKIPCEKRRKEVERIYQRIANRSLFKWLCFIQRKKDLKNGKEESEASTIEKPAEEVARTNGTDRGHGGAKD